ncbi:hypothetical protein DdX_21931 [Ditylenchus destructor]|uniref:Uncharacterized protein n=1 Tax=Ditylenchus destructor TaxID=166010 RepID=A0AAD4QR59_9BILA|nr:hypothetical protein DdX_21931 [Ditylenchus destructor]
MLSPVRCPNVIEKLPNDGKVQLILMKGLAGSRGIPIDIGYESGFKIIKCDECHATHEGKGVVKISPTDEDWTIFIRAEWTKTHDDERDERILNVEGPQWKANGYPKYWVVYTHGRQGSLLFDSPPS